MFEERAFKRWLRPQQYQLAFPRVPIRYLVRSSSA